MNGAAASSAARRSAPAASGWVGFRLAGQRYALDIRCVQEVLADADIEPVPGAPPAVLGVINLRGRIVTVVDLRRCLGFGNVDLSKTCHIVIADVGDDTMGLRVDGVAESCVVAKSAIKPVPPTQGRMPDPLVRGMVGEGDHLLTLLDAGQLAHVAAMRA